jgi:hypothetical protein
MTAAEILADVEAQLERAPGPVPKAVVPDRWDFDAAMHEPGRDWWRAMEDAFWKAMVARGVAEILFCPPGRSEPHTLTELCHLASDDDVLRLLRVGAADEVVIEPWIPAQTAQPRIRVDERTGTLGTGSAFLAASSTHELWVTADRAKSLRGAGATWRVP